MFFFIYFADEDLCSPNPCMSGPINSGVCIQDGEEISCDCNPGFEGPFCQEGKFSLFLLNVTLFSSDLSGEKVSNPIQSNFR